MLSKVEGWLIAEFSHVTEDPDSYYLSTSTNFKETYFKFSLHPWSLFNPKMVPVVLSKQHPEQNNNKQHLYSAGYVPVFSIH